MAISFFCTRCRSLVQFPDRTCGAIVYCPKCGQALIVPTLNRTGSDGSNDSGKSTDSTGSVDSAGSNDSGPVVPGTVRNDTAKAPPVMPPEIYQSASPHRVPVIHHLDESAGEVLYTTRDDFVEGIESGPLPDDEFLDRITETSLAAPKTKEVAQVPTAVPPRLSPEEFARLADPTRAEERTESGSSDSVSNGFVLAVGCAIVFALVVLVAFLWFLFPEAFELSKPKQKSQPVAAETTREPIPIDGKVIYYDANNNARGDDGAIVFLFPSPFPKDNQIVPGTLSSDKPTPVEFERQKARLVGLGGCFVRASSDGFIDMNVPKPGKYMVLIVSAHVAKTSGAEEKTTLTAIGRCLYQPEETLLGRHAFHWREYQFDEQHFRIEYNFGKKD